MLFPISVYNRMVNILLFLFWLENCRCLFSVEQPMPDRWQVLFLFACLFKAGLLDFRYVVSSAIMSKKSNSLPVAGMNGLWGGTESDPLSLMPDCRFGFLFSYLLHFFCWYPLKCAKPDCRNYDSAEGQSERHNTNKSGIAHLLLRVPDCLSVV